MHNEKNTNLVKKVILSTFLILLLASCWTESNISDNIQVDSLENTNEVVEVVEVVEIIDVAERNQEIISLQPEYKAELYWKIKQIEWNMFTISEIDSSKDPTLEMEQAEKKAYMATLSETDKQALKAQVASAFLWDVKVMIPVWIPMIKKELIWEDRQDIEATLADLKTGDIISVWFNSEMIDRKIAMYVKRSMTK